MTLYCKDRDALREDSDTLYHYQHHGLKYRDAPEEVSQYSLTQHIGDTRRVIRR